MRTLRATAGHVGCPCPRADGTHDGRTRNCKAAVEGYVRYAADEFGGDGVTVNALRLGFFDTKATSVVPEQARELLTAAIPAGRLGRPDDIGAVVSLLSQPDAAWINGAVIPATAGLNNPLPLARLLGWTTAERPAS